MLRFSFITIATLGISLAGCGGDDDGPGGGTDGGGALDAGGGGTDAGPGADAGPGVDGGSPGDDGGPGADAGPDVDAGGATDAGTGTDAGGAVTCGPGGTCRGRQICCTATNLCYDPRCLSCCMGPFPDAGGLPDGGFGSFCALVRCLPGLRCCESLRMCIASTTACPGEDAGVTRVDGGPSGCTPPCTGGQLCCASTGTCYDPRCLSCCMFSP